jgi:DNA-directed RNA polymerase specialized sigma24 family protein
LPPQPSRLSMAATLWLTIALPPRELRAHHAPPTPNVSCHDYDAAARIPGRGKRLRCALSIVSADLKGLVQRWGPHGNADDIVQETLLRTLATGGLASLSLAATIRVVSPQQRGRHRAAAPSDPAAGEFAGSPPAGGERSEPRLAFAKLRGMARNVLREHWRQARKVRTVAPEAAEQAIVAATPSPAAFVIAKETAVQIDRLLAGLRPHEREIVRRHAQLGQTFPEIAAAMNLRSAAATKCWQRVVQRLRRDARWLRLVEA